MDDFTVDSAAPPLTEGEILSLEAAGHVIRYPSGSILLGEGEETDFVLLLRKGHVKVEVGTPARIVAIRGPSELVGEMAAHRRKPRSASVFAIDHVEALYLSAKTWMRFLYDHPRAMHAQLVAAEQRLEEATRKRVESYLGVEQRLAKALVELESKGLGNRTNQGISLQFSQRDLADLVGASRESIVQVIRALKNRDIVKTGRQATILQDLDALRSIARGDITASI